MSNLILSGHDYLSLPRAPETFVIEPIIPVGGAVCIYGDPKVGKSFAGIQLALGIVNGTEFLGFPSRVKGNVAYVQLDTPRSLWAARLDSLYGEGYEIDKIHFADRESLGTWPFNILDPEHHLLLTSIVAEVCPQVVIIDTLKEAHQLNENDSTEAQKVIALLTSAVYPAALVLIHHARKPSYDGGPDLLGDARGSGYLMGKMDTIIRMGKKSVHFIGRAIEEGSIKLDRLPNGFWAPQTGETDRIIEGLLANNPEASTSELARDLASRINKSEEASRSLIRRYAEGRMGLAT